MYVIFLLLWILLNGQMTLEIVGIGIVVAGVLYAFVCKFLDYSMQKDMLLFRKLPYIFAYIMVLIWEIIKANMDTIRIGLSYRKEADPVIVRFRTDLKSKTLKVEIGRAHV